MKYSLRSLMIVALTGPPLLAAGYFLLSDEYWHEVRYQLGVWAIVIFVGLVLVRMLIYSRFPDA